MAESQVNRREGIIFIKKEEQQHCEEKKVELNSSRVERRQRSDVKVKASSKYLADRAPETVELTLPAAHILKSDFWNVLPFREMNWRENRYDVARAEYSYAKAMVKLTHSQMIAIMNKEISKLEEVKTQIHHLDDTLDNYLSSYCDLEESHLGVVGWYLPSEVEEDLWLWSTIFEDLKDDLRESSKGNIDAAVDTLGEENVVNDDLEMMFDKPVVIASSTPSQ